MESVQEARSGELVLGLDIGAASVGWALVELRGGQPTGLKAAGVRAFPVGMGNTISDISRGADQSHAAERRQARLRRRQLARRRHRLDKLAGILQGAGLLPPGELKPAEAAVQYFEALDRELFPPEARRANPHLLPYRLRARALEEGLAPYEIGRAIYHLAHRRGFLSNRRVKAGARGDDEQKEEGKVKGAISELAQRIEASGARTLGEYLSKLDPEDERVRGRWLGRKMLEDEFHLIWAGQAAHHPDLLTEELRQKTHRAIFFQRPIKSQRHLVGYCELEEPKRRRAPMCTLAAQRFRLLQKVNDLLVEEADTGRRPLSPEERASLVEALEAQRRLSFPNIRRLLGLRRGVKFNFETEGEKGLPGNRTAHDLAQVFGEGRWAAFSEDERDRVVEDLRSIHNRDALKRRAAKAWGLAGEAAEGFAEIALEDGYCNLSRQALAKVLPLMEGGIQYATARKQLYGDQPPPPVLGALPRLESVLEVRNPAVERALTEVRKVVNAIVREHGRPDRTRIELARDLKKPRKERERISKQNAKNRAARASAAESIKAAKVGIPEPRRSDEEKWLLADECGWQCPYTGKQISVEALFGDGPQFDVEHIIPFHRSLDNSFVNKTLCEIKENRDGKRNRSPWEAYHGTEVWDGIIGRVKQFKSGVARAKLELFLKRPEEIQGLDDFTSQQLTDTRYSSRLATRYVGLLYGAGEQGVDAQGRRRVESSRGQVTAELRGRWGMNAILGGGEKTRDDHRHHAIDAVVVAATDAATIKRFSDAAQNAAMAGRRLRELAPPWPGLLDDVRAAIEGMVVSHRVSRKVAAALHEETVYSKPQVDEQGKPCVHVRKRLEDISKKDLADIVDPAVREAVAAQVEALGEKAFKDRANHPALRAKDGRMIPIHKVRIRAAVSPEQIGGEGAHARQVKLGSNHHVEITETTDKKGNLRWEGAVVSTLEAMRRLKTREPVVKRDHGPGKGFRFSLAGGEIIELNAEEDKKGKTAAAGLYVVRTVTLTGGYPRVDFASISDARLKKDIQEAGDWGWASMTRLQNRHCRKVVVTPLGEVRRVGKD